MIILWQGVFKEQIKKLFKIIPLYHWELLKKRPSMGTFFTQSVNQGLKMP